MTSVPLKISDEFYETLAQRVASQVADMLGRPAEWLTVAQAAVHLQTGRLAACSSTAPSSTPGLEASNARRQ